MLYPSTGIIQDDVHLYTQRIINEIFDFSLQETILCFVLEVCFGLWMVVGVQFLFNGGFQGGIGMLRLFLKPGAVFSIFIYFYFNP